MNGPPSLSADSHAGISHMPASGPVWRVIDRASGSRWRESFASFNPRWSSSKTSLESCDPWLRDQASLLSESSSLIWPNSGMTLDGAAYELPMWEPHIYAAEFSSSDEVLLPTPSASNSHGAEVRWNRKSRGAGGASLRDLPNLLPTPEESRGTPEQHLKRKNKLDGYNRTKVTALGIAVKMLPTPTTQDANNNGGPESVESKH